LPLRKIAMLLAVGLAGPAQAQLLSQPLAPPSGTFTSISSVRAAGNVIRTAWVDSATDNSPDSAYYVNDTGGQIR